MAKWRGRGMARQIGRPTLAGRRVWYAIPPEKCVYIEAAQSWEDLASYNAVHGIARLRISPTRIDIARNRLALRFLETSKAEDDQLVELDADHEHPPDVCGRLAAHNLPVVGALCFRRSEPYDPQFYLRDAHGDLLQPFEFGNGVEKGTIVGTGAICIKRLVFEELERKGFKYPWFRMIYQDGVDKFLGEDWYFAECCEKAGIAHYCDMGLISPHLRIRKIVADDWKRMRQGVTREQAVAIAEQSEELVVDYSGGIQ